MIALTFLLKPQDFNVEKETNFATAGVSADASFQSAIAPVAKAIIDCLQVEILDLYHPGFTLSLSDMEKRSEVDEANIASLLFKEGISTKNEARVRLGLPALDAAGHSFIDGSNT